MFGEKGLDENTLRTATVICATNCHFGIMRKEDYIRVLKEPSLQLADDRKNFFYKEVFSKMVDKAISAIVSFDFFKLKFEPKRNTILYKQGEKPDYIYCVYTGEVLLYCDDYITKEKFNSLVKTTPEVVRQKIAVIGPGTMFGDAFLVLNQKKKARVFNAITVKEDCVILRCTVNCFISRLMRYWEFKNVVVAMIRAKIANRKKVIANIRRQKAHTKKRFNHKHSSLVNIMDDIMKDDGGHLKIHASQPIIVENSIKEVDKIKEKIK